MKFLLQALLQFLFLNVVVAEPHDSNYCYFQRENMTNFETGTPFKVPFFVSFIEVATIPRKHFMEPIDRPDLFKLTISLVTENRDYKRLLFEDKVLAVDGLYDNGAKYIIPTTVEAGKYRILVEFEYLDRILLYKNSENVSPVFELKKGLNDKYNSKFAELGDGGGVLGRKSVSLYFKTETTKDGVEHKLMAQTFKGNRLISTERIE